MVALAKVLPHAGLGDLRHLHATASHLDSRGRTSRWLRATAVVLLYYTASGLAAALPALGGRPTYALRECSRALLAGSKHALASCPQVVAGGDRWLLMAVRGHLGDTVAVSRRSCSHLRGLPGAVTAPCPAQTLPRTRLLPNLTADGVLSRGGEADHE